MEIHEPSVNYDRYCGHTERTNLQRRWRNSKGNIRSSARAEACPAARHDWKGMIYCVIDTRVSKYTREIVKWKFRTIHFRLGTWLTISPCVFGTIKVRKGFYVGWEATVRACVRCAYEYIIKIKGTMSLDSENPFIGGVLGCWRE